MKIALIGKPEAGVPALFGAISGTGGDHRGTRIVTVKVPDPRVDALAEIWNPKKKVYAEVQFLDVNAEAQATNTDAMAVLATCHVIAQIVGAGSAGGDRPDPLRDVNDFAAELILRDQIVVEGRLERMIKAAQMGLERDLLEKLRLHLDAGRSLRALALDDADRRRLAGFGLVSALPLLVVVNVDEDQARAALDPKIAAAVAELGGQVLSLSAALEAEIAQLDVADQQAFLAELGVSESARDRFLRAVYGLLDLITFLTMGEDECRAWSVRRGAAAPEAAGRIHSDLERGFIRAEVIQYQDFVELKSEAACRKAGKQRVEGKEYLVQEGDILHIRFNV
ncbi:MAG: redox-regulated ATPase YchF [Deltaproteobacteria bacterium]|nr:redox-regulated ATPase YchF [Deltaproteobacteria bacterium]